MMARSALTSTAGPEGGPRTTLRIRLLQVGYDDDEPVADRIERVAGWVGEQRDADLVVLPELWSHGGFAYQDWRERAESWDGPTMSAIADAAQRSGAYVHAGSIIEREPAGPAAGSLWNCSAVFGPKGDLLTRYRKVHRFGFGEGEPQLLQPGTSVADFDLERPGGRRTRLGLATCYDLRFPELFRLLASRGTELFVVPAAWPAQRAEHWRLLGRARAVENQSIVVQCNTAGTHAHTRMAGQSQVVGPTGVVLARAGTDEQELAVEVDLCEVTRYRHEFPALADRRL